jgi:FixJ family two-component response regulator
MQMPDGASTARVHVLDFDFRRRAEISRELIARSYHAEVYEDADEFLQVLPARGSVLMVEGAAPEGLADFLASLRLRGQYYPVSVYSEDPSPGEVVQAMRDGAIDYLVWPFDSGLLTQALDRLRDEGDRRRKIEFVKKSAKTSVGQLTGRERDVLVSLLNGNSNKQIAAELDLSPRTVEIYRKNVMLKLDAKSVSDAVRIGIYADLWELPVV